MLIKGKLAELFERCQITFSIVFFGKVGNVSGKNGGRKGILRSDPTKVDVSVGDIVFDSGGLIVFGFKVELEGRDSTPKALHCGRWG